MRVETTPLQESHSNAKNILDLPPMANENLAQKLQNLLLLKYFGGRILRNDFLKILVNN